MDLENVNKIHPQRICNVKTCFQFSTTYKGKKITPSVCYDGQGIYEIVKKAKVNKDGKVCVKSPRTFFTPLDVPESLIGNVAKTYCFSKTQFRELSKSYKKHEDLFSPKRVKYLKKNNLI